MNLNEKRSFSKVKTENNTSKRRHLSPVRVEVDGDLLSEAISQNSSTDRIQGDRSLHTEGGDDKVESSDEESEGSASSSSSSSSSIDSDSDSDSVSSSDAQSDASNRDESSPSEEEGTDDSVRREFSEKERFLLQSKYRDLDEELIKQRTKIALEGGVQIVTKSLEKADDLFAQTKSGVQTNIVAKDSSTLKEIGYQARVATKSLRLGRSEKLLDFKEFTENFNDKFGSKERAVSGRSDLVRVNWLELGCLFNRISSRAATCDFLLGPLELANKQRQVRKRVADDSRTKITKTANEKEAQEIVDRDKMDVTTKNSENLFKQLRALNFKKVPFFNFFIDPVSFGRSVENLFYTSFLINHDKVILSRDESTGLLYIQQASNDTLKNHPRFIKKEDSKSHIIFDLDYNTWKQIVQIYEIEEPFLKAA